MAQFDQLLLFYNQLINLSDEITNLIEKELYDDIMTKMSIHDRIILQIKLIKKCTKFSENEINKIKEYENIIKDKEKSNIEFLNQNMNNVKQELDKLNIQTKIKRIYNQQSINIEQGSIIDIEDSYKQQK